MYHKWLSAIVSMCIISFLAVTDSVAGPSPEELGKYVVGHSIIEIASTGSVGEARPVYTHVWYPADKRNYDAAPRTVYRHRLYGVPLIPGTYDALSAEIVSRLAREDVSIQGNRDNDGESRGRKRPTFPLVIFSHGSLNDAFDFGFLAERLASHGYVVAGPSHMGDSQDDSLVTFINQVVGRQLLECLDGLPPPCIDDSRKSVKDRALDVAAVVDAFGVLNDTQFDSRVDMDRVGVLGYSRGGVNALATLSGSRSLGIPIDSRVKAVMTQAIGQGMGGNSVYDATDLANVTAPVLMMASTGDRASPLAQNRAAFDMLTNAPRIWVVLNGGEHRSYNATSCDRTQATAAISLSNPQAVLEDRISRNLLVHATNGVAMDFCQYETFVNPIDISSRVQTVASFAVTEENVPRTLASDDVLRLSSLLAVSFFDVTLAEKNNEILRFKKYLTPHYLLERESNIVAAETVLRQGAQCQKHQGCTE